MSNTLQVPLSKPLVGLRLHTVLPEGQVAEDPTSQWLLSLRETAVQDAHRHAELMTTLDSLQDAIKGLPSLVRKNLAEVSQLSTEIGLAIAQEVLGDALERGSIDPMQTLDRCLSEASIGLDGVDLAIYMHPGDLSQVLNELESDPEMRERLGGAQLHADAGLQRSAVRIDTEVGRLSYDYREILLRVSKAVRAAIQDQAAEAPANPGE